MHLHKFSALCKVTLDLKGAAQKCLQGPMMMAGKPPLEGVGFICIPSLTCD